MLLGSGIAVVFGWLGAVSSSLFVDDIRAVRREPPGGRACGRWGMV